MSGISPEILQDLGRASDIRRRAAKYLRVPKPLTVSDWADRFRHVPAESTSEPGRWRTSRFPFLREIMDFLSKDSPVHRVVVMKGTQLGFTETGLNWIFYTIAHAPGPMLYVQKTDKDIQDFISQRVEGSLSAMPAISKLIRMGKGRKAGSTTKRRNFPGGILFFGHAGSASGMRSRPVGKLVLDEVDSYTLDLSQEGNPVDLAIKRTSNFPDHKIYELSTPKIEETSRINRDFLAGDQRFYYVPCPFCDHYQVIHWQDEISGHRGIQWEEGKPETAVMVCEECGAAIDEHHKTKMLAAGEWRATNPEGRFPSYHISALYSPLGFYSWKQAVEEFLDAKASGDPTALKTWIQTTLGEPWRESLTAMISTDDLYRRREVYPAPVPEMVHVLTAGVDIQEDRIEMEVVGWGKGEESWAIDYKVLTGSTESMEVWGLLTEALNRTYLHETGVEIPIMIAAVDSSFNTKRTYAFTSKHPKAYAIKGKEGFGIAPVVRGKRPVVPGVVLRIVAVDEYKLALKHRLNFTEPGPGFCHWPRAVVVDGKPQEIQTFEQDYFNQLRAEHLEKYMTGGRERLRFTKPSASTRNEALDCRVYATAALKIRGIDLSKVEGPGPMVLQVPKRRKGVRKLSDGV
ncbi:phage terminase large subunit family protein [bacterium]|nr:phage terminase large subunit family protein [bacterium]